MKIATIIGARPQFIKAAAVSRKLAAESSVVEVLVHTGQHYDANMSDIFFKELDLPEPDYSLCIGGGTHGAMTGRQLEAIERVLVDEQPDCVVVYGDTNSTLAGALAAVKLQVPVAHVEAGLRSFNRSMPEEINRILTDHASNLLFAPTVHAVRNLRNEGFAPHIIHHVGDVMYDAAVFYRDRAYPPAWFRESGLEEGEFVLATVHRAENTDNPVRLTEIFKGFGMVPRPVVLPIHPRTGLKLKEFSIEIPSNIRMVDAVGYLEMVWLEAHSKIIATDSGGVQKEAYFQGKQCVTLREETEWMELVESGCNVLVGSCAEKIAHWIEKGAGSGLDSQLYGEGNAAELIIKGLLQ